MDVNSKKCYELLRELYADYSEVNTHLDSLHEMMIAYFEATEPTKEQQQKVIQTYKSLRHLLQEVDTLFKE